MADTKAAPAAAPEEQRKTVVVVGVDDSDHSYHALEWMVQHLAAGMAGANELVVVHAKPSPSSVVRFGGVGAEEVIRFVEADLRKTAEEVVDRARRLCIANSMHALIEVIEGEPRAFLGSVSDYCDHHAHCSVMIVKQPNSER